MNDAEFERLKWRLAAEGTLRLTVVTGSMRPLLPIGETVQVAPLRGSPRPFDIVVFRSADRLICHYVVHANRLGREEPVLVTRALSGRHEDLPVELREVLGRVVSHRVPPWNRFLAVAARLFARLGSERGD